MYKHSAAEFLRQSCWTSINLDPYLTGFEGEVQFWSRRLVRLLRETLFLLDLFEVVLQSHVQVERVSAVRKSNADIGFSGGAFLQHTCRHI